MSSSVDSQSGSRAHRSRSPSASHSEQPPERRISQIEPDAGRGAPSEPEREKEGSRRNALMAEGLRQLALAVMIVLVLGFVSLRIFSPREAADQGASLASRSASLTNSPKRVWAPPTPAPRLEVGFDRSAPAGQPTPLRLTVADAPEGSTVVVSGFGPGTTLSAGEDRDVEWRLGLADLSNLSVIPPKDFVGTMVLVVELRLPDGGVGARKIFKLEWTGETAAQTEKPPASENPPPAAESETPLATAVTRDPAPAAESVKEKQLAPAAPQEEEPAMAETPARSESPAKEAAAAPPQAEEGETGRLSPCFAKLDGKVVLQGRCRIVWTEERSVTFGSGDKRLSITLDHGRVWRLNWNGQDKGKIFRRKDCWGSEKAYVCEHAL